jgi:hypothetical protein
MGTVRECIDEAVDSSLIATIKTMRKIIEVHPEVTATELTDHIEESIDRIVKKSESRKQE